MRKTGTEPRSEKCPTWDVIETFERRVKDTDRGWGHRSSDPEVAPLDPPIIASFVRFRQGMSSERVVEEESLGTRT